MNQTTTKNFQSKLLDISLVSLFDSENKKLIFYKKKSGKCSEIKQVQSSFF